ncbi:MAG: M14 family zinc carboxypeptidase [Candidatus Aminicenantaceae bacterium]
MKKRSLLYTFLFLFIFLWSCAEKVVNRDEFFQDIVSSMPDYEDFLTVDELHQSLSDLKKKYSKLIVLSKIGETEMGNPIFEFKIGEGKYHALFFGFPHPNEPIGSMMLHYLTQELAANKDLRKYFDYTWHIVICAEPDKAKLNEGWFKGKLTLTKYARNYYRPPSHQQVEWTFPMTYKKYSFDNPTPEAQALMKIIDNNPISFSFGLHNSGFGGVYYYWSHDVQELYPILYGFIEKQGLPLHLGEPEVPYIRKFDDKSMFKMLYFTDDYDYMDKFSPVPPEKILKSGASSDDYIKERYHALTVNCELPYFYDPKIEDTSLSDMTRREAMLKRIEYDKETFYSLKEKYDKIQPFLTQKSLFIDTIEEALRIGENEIITMENTVKTEKEYERQATNAEKWDALSLTKFGNILALGQLLRLLEYEKDQVGPKFPVQLQEILERSIEEFDEKAKDAESELDYTVIPIKKLASIQLMTALYAMDYVQRNPDF